MTWFRDNFNKLVVIGIVMLLVFILVDQAKADGVSSKDSYTTLKASVAELRSNGRTICTTFKIGPKRYMTAGHCLRGGGKITVFIEDGYVVENIRSILVAQQIKKSGKEEDWAVLNLVRDTEQPALVLGCTDTVEPADPVATYGYPGVSHPQFYEGIITGDGPHTRGHNSGLMTSIHADGGASGSPVVNQVTKHVIGILTEGIPARFGAIGTGLERIVNTDDCEDVIEYQAWQEENANPSPF